jgi:hypothetical protein
MKAASVGVYIVYTLLLLGHVRGVSKVWSLISGIASVCTCWLFQSLFDTITVSWPVASVIRGSPRAFAEVPLKEPRGES